MYLWCSRCLKAAPETAWSVTGYKYGVCPKCGSSAYRNSVEWQTVAAANGYPDTPEDGVMYELEPSLF
jgi:hypothetical protein